LSDEEVFVGQVEQLGPNHASTLLTKGNLAVLLMEMGELVEARRVCDEVLAGWTEQLRTIDQIYYVLVGRCMRGRHGLLARASRRQLHRVHHRALHHGRRRHGRLGGPLPGRQSVREGI
jgi:hypothetical protein